MVYSDVSLHKLKLERECWLKSKRNIFFLLRWLAGRRKYFAWWKSEPKPSHAESNLFRCVETAQKSPPVNAIGQCMPTFQKRKIKQKTKITDCIRVSIQIDASLQIRTCVRTCYGWPNGFANRLASSRKSQNGRKFNADTVDLRSTCVDLRWVAKRWKLASTCVRMTKVNASQHKWVAKKNASRKLNCVDLRRLGASPFGQAFTRPCYEKAKKLARNWPTS